MAEIETTKVSAKTFENEEIRLDGREYDGCTFRNCTIVYGGGNTAIHGNKFHNCKFRFDGSAARTLQFLANFGREGGEMRALVATLVSGTFPYLFDQQ